MNKLYDFIMEEFEKGTTVKELNEMADSYAFNREDLLNLLKNLQLVAYAKTNDRGDLFDLRLQNNIHDDQNKIVPLFRFKKNDA